MEGGYDAVERQKNFFLKKFIMSHYEKKDNLIKIGEILIKIKCDIIFFH
jgi:hypothetical protein